MTLYQTLERNRAKLLSIAYDHKGHNQQAREHALFVADVLKKQLHTVARFKDDPSYLRQVLRNEQADAWRDSVLSASRKRHLVRMALYHALLKKLG